MDVTVYIIWVLVGTLIGLFVGFILTRKPKVGVLNVDRSIDGEGPYLFLELDEDVENVSKRRYVTLEVRNKNYIASHE